jgi:hypothetical protein
MIHDLYETDIVGAFYGIGCVQIMTTSKNQARIISKALKAYTNGKLIRSKANSEQEQEAPQI